MFLLPYFPRKLFIDVVFGTLHQRMIHQGNERSPLVPYIFLDDIMDNSFFFFFIPFSMLI